MYKHCRIYPRTRIIFKVLIRYAAVAALKTSARAKLVAGQPLTEEEAATLVL